MERDKFRSTMLIGALVAGALIGHSSQATTLQSFAIGERSFWDPGAWAPAATPGPGDSVRALNFQPQFYLGDFGPFPAQNRQISRLHFDGTAAQGVLRWGSKLVGGQAGGLSFSQDDPADFGTGIRIGRISGPSGNLVIFINPENTQAEAMNIRIGGGLLSDGGFGDALQLFGGPTNFYADQVTLSNATHTQLFIGGPQLVANRLHVSGAVDATVTVARGSLTTSAAFLDNSALTSQVPLLVASGATANIENLNVIAANAGSVSTIQIGSPAVAFSSGGTGSFQVATAAAAHGGVVRLVVDGVGGAATSLTMRQLYGSAIDGRLELQALNGGELDIAQATLYNTLSTPGQLSISVDGTGSRLVGGAISTAFPGAFEVLGGGATFDFSNGGRCVACDLHVGATGNARISGDSVVDFVRIRMDGIDSGSGSQPANATITKSSKSVAAPEVIVGRVNVDSDFVLSDTGSKTGGDLFDGPAGPTTGSHLTVELGSRLRIGADVGTNDAPLLAIGKLGVVTLDAASSAYIGDPLATASYTPGMITLATGGSIYGNGVINGIGFSAGSNPTVLNTGGTLHPGFSPGKLTIDGQYIQQDGELELEIGGINPGEYDVLDASQGARFLGGTIRIVLLNSFGSPVDGTRFDFFGSSGLNFFDPAVSIIDETGLELVFDFSTGAATIGTPVPLPPTAPLFALECLGLLGFGWRRQQARALAA